MSGFVPLPPFPNVPNLPGVPQLARSISFPTSAPTIGSQATSGALWHAVTAAPVWAVVDSTNTPVVTPDSVMDFGWRQEYKVSNYPIQQGQFASYNKVRVPFESSVVMTKGGTLHDRNQFLQQIDHVAASLGLYTIVTPEKSYLNVNVTRAELSRRGSGNAYYFDVEMFFIQIIEITPQYSSTVAPSTVNSSVPSAAPAVNTGQSNAQTPSTAVQAAALAAITPGAP